MRELKFRVWTGAEMVHDVTVGKFGNFYVNPGPNGNGLRLNDMASLTTYTTKYPEGTPVMQYTGLKDFKGNEIYEGDVMAVFLGEAEGYDHVPVVFKNGCFMVGKLSPTPLKEELDYWNGNICVAGNIYENPDLLGS